MTCTASNFRITLCAAVLLGLLAAQAAPAAELQLVPWPKTVKAGDSMLELTKDTRIVATDPSLAPLAKVLADELCRSVGAQYAVAQGEVKDGDIVLKLDPSLKGEAYTLMVEKTAVVSGGNYAAVAMGTVTLSQAIQQAAGKVSVPTLKVEDAPDYRMRAIQMCIKHQEHRMSTIKQGVDLCRQYKLNTLALHCSNYQILWLLCPAFRENPLSKDSVPGWGNGGATYSPEEWNDLVEYGRLRGVAILPEWGPEDFVYFMKGWFYKARQFVPDFDPAKQSLLDSPKFWEAIDEMSGQLAKIFYTSEYIHVGALNGETGPLETELDAAFMKKEGLRHSGDVWAWVLKRLYEINKKHGKETMAFEGVDADSAAHVKLPKEVAFFAYQTWYYPADQMIVDGYRVLNAAWRPLYTCGGYPAHEIYNWNPRTLWHNIDSSINVQLPKSDLLIGSLLSTWEGAEFGHIDLLTDRGAAMAERCWNENAGKTWQDFSQRLKPTMARLQAILCPAGLAIDGLLDTSVLPPGWPVPGKACYADKLTITMKPNEPGVKAYYTEDGSLPGPANPKSKLYEGPLVFTNNCPALRVQCFDAAGKPFGGEYLKIFVQMPIQMTIEGADEKFDAWGRFRGRTFKAYCEKVVVKFSTPTGEKLRYRTTPPEAQPATPDLEYTGPITINKSTSFWVGKGKEGYQLITGVGDDGFTPNLLTDPGVEVTVSHTSAGDKKFIVDGYVDPSSHWNGVGQPAWVKIKLPKARKINKLEVFCWWGYGDNRAYRYNVEVSMTGKDGQWKQIVDMKQNAKPAEGGYTHTFDPVEVQYIRINMFGNTTNDHNHLCEVRAFATE